MFHVLPTYMLSCNCLSGTLLLPLFCYIPFFVSSPPRLLAVLIHPSFRAVRLHLTLCLILGFWLLMTMFVLPSFLSSALSRYMLTGPLLLSELGWCARVLGLADPNPIGGSEPDLAWLRIQLAVQEQYRKTGL